MTATAIPQPRIVNPARLMPDAQRAIMQLHGATMRGGVPEATLALAHLRVSQINGCSFCVESGTQKAMADGESAQRLPAVGAWRESPHFTDAERAALALAECVTRLDDRPDPVPDAVWDEAARHYDETQLVTLLLSIATTNVFNRINVPLRQPAGNWG